MHTYLEAQTHIHTHTHKYNTSLHCWDVLAREGIGCVTDKKASFTNSPAKEEKMMLGARKKVLEFTITTQRKN